jgi:hypothetical protein
MLCSVTSDRHWADGPPVHGVPSIQEARGRERRWIELSTAYWRERVAVWGRDEDYVGLVRMLLQAHGGATRCSHAVKSAVRHPCSGLLAPAPQSGQEDNAPTVQEASTDTASDDHPRPANTRGAQLRTLHRVCEPHKLAAPDQRLDAGAFSDHGLSSPRSARAGHSAHLVTPQAPTQKTDGRNQQRILSHPSIGCHNSGGTVTTAEDTAPLSRGQARPSLRKQQTILRMPSLQRPRIAFPSRTALAVLSLARARSAHPPAADRPGSGR